MEHQFYIDRLSAYFDNELKNEEFVIVKEHIDSCDECQKRLAELEKLENLFTDNSELSESEYWEQSAQKIEASLDAQTPTEIIPIKKTKSSLSLWWKLTGVAASLVLVAIFAFEQKDVGDELLMEEKNNSPIENRSASVQIAKDTITDEELSLGNIVADADDMIETALELNQPIAQPSQVITPKKKTRSKKQVASKPQPVKLEKEKVKTQQAPPVIAEIVEEKIIEEPAPVKLRTLEFQNGGGTIATSDNYIKLDQTSKVQSDNLVEDESESVATTQIFSNTFDSTLPNKLQDGFGKTAELEYWRRRVATNNDLLKARKKNTVQYSKSSKSTTRQRGKSTNRIDVEFTYKQIFEAYYHIAILTNASFEVKQAVDFLTMHADSLTTTYSSNALYYLQLYQNEMNRQENKKNQEE